MDELGYTFEWPLWGMSLDTRPGLEAGLRIGDSLLYQPTWAQWSEMELSAVIDEYCRPLVFAEAMGKDVRRLPPPCLLRISPADADGEPDPPEDEHQAEARAVVAALRVYDTGDFVNPNETGTYVSHPSGLVSREVSALRCALYDWSPVDPYQVSAAELDDLESLTSACWVISEEPGHGNAGLALENLLLSFGFVTPPAERGLHCFIALEALFGGMGEVKHGAPFDTRVANAVPDGQVEVRGWLVDTGVGLRNTLAHGISEVVPDAEDLDMLTYVVRHALISYFNHVGSAEHATLSSFNRALAQGPIPSEP